MILKVETVYTKIVQDTEDKLNDIDPVKELKDYLKIKVDGYFHSPAYKKKRWDGTKSFVAYSKFLTGFLPYILKYCDREGLEYTVEDLRPNAPKLKDGKLIVQFGDKTLADHQIRAIRSVENFIGTPEIYFPHGVFNAATNSGKTLMVEGLISNFERPVKVLYLVHGKDLYVQAVSDFSNRHNVGTVNTNSLKFDDVTVCMKTTLYNRAKDSMSVRHKLADYDVVVVDECHHACGGQYEDLLKMIPAPIRIGTSGTPRDQPNNVKKLTCTGLMSADLIKITNEEMIEIGFSLKPIVRMYYSNESVLSLQYDEIVNDCIHYSKKRLSWIYKEVKMSAGRQILVTCIDIMHGEFLKRSIANKFSDLVIEFTNGGLAQEERESILRRYNDGEIHVLVSSMIVKEGLNIPTITKIIRGEGGKSRITTKQLSGRGMRKNGEEEEIEIVDFYDEGKYISDHSRKRARDYIKEGFEFSPQYESRRNYIPL